MKARKQKHPNDYPRFTIRIDGELLARAEAVARNGGVSVGSLIGNCIRCKLPDFEKLQEKITASAKRTA